MAFLIDAGWMEVIIGVLAIIITIVLYRFTMKKKSLSYEVVSEYPLITIDEEIKGKLQILLDGNPVEDVHLLLIKFINDGNIPIAASDYERPLTLDFKNDSNILSADYIKASPKNLTTSLEITGNNISIEPMLMNGGDSFTIKVLVSQYKGSLDLDARIFGVKNIRRGIKQSSTYKRGVSIAGFQVLTTKVLSPVLSVLLVLFSLSIPPLIVVEIFTPNEIVIHTGASQVKVGERVAVWASVDNNLGNWSYVWNASTGEVLTDSSHPALATYVAPPTPALAQIEVTVVGRFGFKKTEIVSIPVVAQ